MKQLLRSLIRGAGIEPLRRTDDPVLHSLLNSYNELRLHPDDQVRWLHLLPRLASIGYLRQALREHSIDLLLDVGANVGQFALDARRTGYLGEIISFEPIASHCDHLTRLAEQDGNWRVVPVALGDQHAEATLNVYRDTSFSSLHSINDETRRAFGSMVELDHTERVIVCTIDEIGRELGCVSSRRIFLKTDTQGHDAAVLRGAERTLTFTKAVLTETSVASLYDGAASGDETIGLLLANGFVPGGMFPTTYRPGTIALIELDSYFTSRGR